MGAYEALWAADGATTKRIADLFRDSPNALPSELVPEEEARRMAKTVLRTMRETGVRHFGIRVHRAGEYPRKLRDAKHPLEVLYYQGMWNLTETRSVSVVGTRTPTEEGRRRTRKLTKGLVAAGFTIVSGLAAGVDTEAHTSAIAAGGRTIAVLGTPLSQTYPRQNAELQKQIAANFLVISQVPSIRYSRQTPYHNRYFFPERNITMSALTEATIIVEAGETSGTRTQARAALHQGRKLFLLDNMFRNNALTWPRKYQKKGAIRVSSLEQILAHLNE